MLTVMVSIERSGISRTRRPLGRRYSVTPSIEAPRVTPAGRPAPAAWAGASVGTNRSRAARSLERVIGLILDRQRLGKFNCIPGGLEFRRLRPHSPLAPYTYTARSSHASSSHEGNPGLPGAGEAAASPDDPLPL